MPKRTAAALAILLVTALLIGTSTPAGAQNQPVRFDGRVQWVAGQLMAVGLDSGLSVSVDLARVPLDQYTVLGRGERVIIIGVITDGNRRVLGTSVVRGGEVEAP
jgi:hypothetical protein